MEVKWRKMSNPSEDFQIQVLIEMLINIRNDTMHAIQVDIAASRRVQSRTSCLEFCLADHGDLTTAFC